MPKSETKTTYGRQFINASTLRQMWLTLEINPRQGAHQAHAGLGRQGRVQGLGAAHPRLPRPGRRQAG